MSWEGKYDWKDHKEIAKKLSKEDQEELSYMLNRHWIDVPIYEINNMIRQFDKELLQHEISTSVASYDKLK